jgi:beta-glucanase (GH16 family)
MNRTRSLVASAAAVVVTAAGLTLTTPAQPAFASTSFALSPSTPIAGESFAATGRVSTKFKRPVVLRVYSGGAWRTAKGGWTTSSGTYRLPTTGVSAATAYDVVARAYKYKGRTYGQTVSATRTLRPVGQSATISVLPQVVQRGGYPAGASGAVNSVIAKFSPARPGRPVTFYRSSGGPITTTQRSDGTALFRANVGGGTISATTAARYGAPAASTSAAVNDWALQFSDEFEGTSLKTGNWGYRNEGVYIGARTKSKSDRRAVTVGGGTVALQVKKDPSSSYKLLNGQITSQNKFHFTYGVAAARIKFQRGRGQHGSFWLQSPTYNSYPGNPGKAGAEVDAVEYFGQGYPDGGLAQFLYYRNSSRKDVKIGGVQPAASRLKPSSDTWWDSYHVFSVKWTPQSYTMYVDGQQVYFSTKALSHTQQFLILSLLSSDWELKYLDRSHLSTKSLMRVDWARVWQRPTP